MAQPGFRTQVLVVVTTLLDAALYPRQDVAILYRIRWYAELDLRALKQTLQMDVLRGQSPAMVRKEVWAHLLAYNLVRQVIAQAAGVRGRSPRQISVAGARQMLDAFRSVLSTDGGVLWDQSVAAMLHAVGGRRVGMRPDRCEPREVKRRPKVYPLMTRTRGIGRATLLAGTETGKLA